MNLSIDIGGLLKETVFALTLKPRAKALVWTQIRVASFNAERYIKIAMPVDTGRARSSWGHSGGAPALPDDSIWDENQDNLSITQGSRVDYIEYLNEGSSKQAPAGFIDACERRALQEMADAMGDSVEALFK